MQVFVFLFLATLITHGHWAGSGDPPHYMMAARSLVAEDVPEVRQALADMLSRHGANVTAVGSSNDALEALVRSQADVLVSDVEIPGESGYALIRKVRALPADRGGRTPAVALSALGRTEDRVTSLEAGFQVHLAKPVQPAELVAAVASLGGRTPSR